MANKANPASKLARQFKRRQFFFCIRRLRQEKTTVKAAV